MKRMIVLALCLMLGSCAADRQQQDYNLPLPGPTAMRKTADGYVLVNRWYRVVIDESTGDIIYWGSADGQQNLLGPRGARARLTDDPAGSAPKDGYVEKRDDQTWQYLGIDETTQTGWRKIYCLEGRSLFATFLIENRSEDSRPMGVTLSFDLTVPDVAGSDLAADGPTNLGHVYLRGYPEHAELLPARSSPPILVGDTKHLGPGERIGYTTEWKIERP